MRFPIQHPRSSFGHPVVTVASCRKPPGRRLASWLMKTRESHTHTLRHGLLQGWRATAVSAGPWRAQGDPKRRPSGPSWLSACCYPPSVTGPSQLSAATRDPLCSRTSVSGSSPSPHRDPHRHPAEATAKSPSRGPLPGGRALIAAGPFSALPPLPDNTCRKCPIAPRIPPASGRARHAAPASAPAIVESCRLPSERKTIDGPFPPLHLSIGSAESVERHKADPDDPQQSDRSRKASCGRNVRGIAELVPAIPPLHSMAVPLQASKGGRSGKWSLAEEFQCHTGPARRHAG